MKYKLNEDGSIAVDDKGQPIVIDDSDPQNPREFSLDAIHLYSQIPKLQTDIKAANTAATEAKNALIKFAGIEDPEAALTALETVKNLEEGDLKKASDVQKKIDDLNKENVAKLQVASAAHEVVVEERNGVIENLNTDLNKAVIGQAFAQSAWFNGKEPKSKLGPSVAESFLGKYFKVERLADGQVVPVAYVNGVRIEDAAKGLIGDSLAPMLFDDAMTTIVKDHPQAADILWPSSGSGSRGSDKNHLPGQKKTIDGGDPITFGENLEDIASGKVIVNPTE